MRTALSTRRAKFYSLIRQANDQPTDWLRAALQDKTHNNGYMSALSRLACLRILVARNGSGRPYPEKKRAVRAELGI